MMLNEQERALRRIDKVLARPSGDPDDDVAVLARQLQRRNEQCAALLGALKDIVPRFERCILAHKHSPDIAAQNVENARAAIAKAEAAS